MRISLDWRALGNEGETWFAALGVFVLTLGACWLVKNVLLARLRALAKKTRTDVDDFLIDLVGRVGGGTYFVIALYAAARSLTLPVGVVKLVTVLFVVVVTFKGILLLQDVVLFFLRRAYRAEEDPGAKEALRNISTAARVLLWGGALVFALDNLGFDIGSVLAGLGIGGVAVALAAQAILGDLFSCFSIYLDKPFKVGDFIIVGDLLGVVEHIGLKTTRVRSLWGEQLVFSNTDLTSSRIRNFGRMTRRRVQFGFGVVYQTPVEKMKRIPGWVKEIVEGIEKTTFDRAHFKGFGASSLDFEVVYYVESSDYNFFMDVQQTINLRLMEKFEAEGVEFAYPTRTLYIEKGG